MDKVFLRIKQELRNLKQIRQRSSAAVATLQHPKAVTLSISGATTGISTGEKTLHLKNLGDAPMIFDVIINSTTSPMPANGRLYYVQWADETNPLDYYLQINAVVYQSDYSGTVQVPLIITATSDFEIEEIV